MFEHRKRQPQFSRRWGEHATRAEKVGHLADKLGSAPIVSSDVLRIKPNACEPACREIQNRESNDFNVVNCPRQKRLGAATLPLSHAVKLTDAGSARPREVNSRHKVRRVPPPAVKPSPYARETVAPWCRVTVGEPGPWTESEAIDRVEQLNR